MSFNHQQIQEAYKKLTPEIQDFVMSTDTTEILTAIFKKNELNDDQADTADSEVLYAMYGLETLDDAINNIASYMGKKAADLSELKTDLQNSIFSQYKELGVVSSAPTKPQAIVEQKAESVERSSKEPIIITQDTKQQALEELKKRREVAAGSVTAKDIKIGEPVVAPKQAPASMPEVQPPANLPVVEEGEKAHTVPPLARENKVEVNKIEIKKPEEAKPAQAAPAPQAPIKAVEAIEPKPVVSAPAPAPKTEAKSQTAPAAPTNSKYPGGVDPYREPLD